MRNRILFFGEKKMARKTFKSQKPKKFDGHLVYECPDCHADNYITLSEAMTEGYIIVCPDCDSVLKPEPVSKIKVYYEADQNRTKAPPTPPANNQPVFHSPKSETKKESVDEKPIVNNDYSCVTEIDEINIENADIVPQHEYMKGYKTDDIGLSDFQIHVLTNEQISVITESVKVLKRYGYNTAAANKLASDCMRENCADLTIDTKKLLEICLRKEGAKLNE